MILLRLALAAVIAVAYFCCVWLFIRPIYKDVLFFHPKWSMIAAFINCCVILFSSFGITKKTVAWWKQNIRKRIAIIAAIICCLSVPFLLMKSGTAADDHSIKEINILGNVTKEYKYTDIAKIELSVQYGIQYDITFKSGEKVEIASHEIIFLNSFDKDENMVTFDKLISEYAEATVSPSTYLTPSNVRRFFADEDSYKYFDDIFREYYK